MTDKFNHPLRAVASGSHSAKEALGQDGFETSSRTRFLLFIAMMTGLPSIAFAFAWYVGTGDTTKYGITAIVLLVVTAVAGLKLTAAGAEDEQRVKEECERRSS